MKIASYEASILLVPEDDPLANMPEEAGRKRPIVTVRLRTEDGMQAARQAAAIERDADAFDAGIGAQPNRHDGPLAAGFLRHVGQGIVLGDEQDAGLIARDLHARLPRCLVSAGNFRISRILRYPLRRWCVPQELHGSDGTQDSPQMIITEVLDHNKAVARAAAISF